MGDFVGRGGVREWGGHFGLQCLLTVPPSSGPGELPPTLALPPLRLSLSFRGQHGCVLQVEHRFEGISEELRECVSRAWRGGSMPQIEALKPERIAMPRASRGTHGSMEGPGKFQDVSTLVRDYPGLVLGGARVPWRVSCRYRAIPVQAPE